ncbi:MAG: DUF1573 domain-containing protein [Odoribacteraceae bacterium]|jgi:hypothetical protein|nr:DUF1573 domain-containing protein [Odoribacteraceae bacterium]
MNITIISYAVAGTLLLHACKGKEGRNGDPFRFHASDSTRLTRVELPETMFDFGKVARGEIVSHAFSVKNTGDKDLIIIDVLTGCGCTSLDFPRRPVKPGKSGKIEVKFNSNGLHGLQHKTIHVYANVRERRFELLVKASIQN